MGAEALEHDEGVIPGQLIANRYEVERVLGKGGMGVVALANDTQLDRKVALKFMLAEKAKEGDAAARFFREARAAGKLANEHVARVYDVGTSEAGHPFIVMEYLVGTDLGDLLEKQGLPSIDTAIDWIMQACEGLAEAHGAGIVHRDLKPSNLFLTERPSGRKVIKIVDFGISKMTSEHALGRGDITSTQTAMGSPLYMSPEQMRSARAADARSDIWALGVMLYELLTGTTPFVAETITELALVVSQDTPTAPEVLRPGISEGLSKIVQKCLAKDPSERYFSVNALASALGAERQGGRVPAVSSTSLPAVRVAGPFEATFEAPSSGVPHVASIPRLAQTDAVSVASTTPRTQQKKRAWLPIAAAAGVVVIVAIVGGLAMRGAPASVATAQPSTTASVASSAHETPVVATTAAPLADLPQPQATASATAVVVAPTAKPHTSASKPATPAPSTTAQSCTPPYYFDAAGHKIYKVNCL